MAFDLRLTTAGRTALADGANVGASAVRLTHVAIGDGSGPGEAADDGLAALRSERGRVAAEGSAPVERRIAFRGDFMPVAAYDVTEVGVFGSAPGGATALLAYWSDGGAVIGGAVAGTKLVVAAVLEFVAAAAEVAVTLSPVISLGGDGLPATEARRGIVELATSDEAKTGTDQQRALTPKAMRDSASATAASLLPGGAPAEGTKYRFAGKPMGKLELEEDSGDAATTQAIGAVQADIATITAALDPLPGQVGALTGEVGAVKGRVSAVEGKTGDATTSRKGIVELATSDEARTGTDEQRAVTPKAMRDSASHNLESLLAGNAEDGKRYALEGRANGRLAVTELPFEHFFEAAASTHNRNTVITIDGDSEWTIGATGSYAITFVAAGVSSTQLRFQKQSSGEASWATLSGQFYARGDDSAASNEVRGCAWCGDLSQGDKIRVHGTTEAQIFSDPPTFTISKKTLMILRT